MDARILVVDDDPVVRDFLSDVLQTDSGAVSVASSLTDGLRAAASTPFDVIFLDVHLPDGSGLEAVGSFRRSPGRPEVLIMTGQGDPRGAALALRHGAWDYLCKPLGADDVRLAVMRAMDFRRSTESNRSAVFTMADFVSTSPAMAECLRTAARAAASDVPVLIRGETGTGKERLARGIHDNSARASKAFVVVDCTVIPEALMESHLFGHEKGAFTGADRRRIGLVQMAHEGTLFLDEVGDLPLGAQAKLLRVLQEKTFRPMGAKDEVRSDFRLLAATNRNLEAMVREGHFRDDLYYRMAGMTLTVPPLRDRKDDILPLVQEVLRREARRTGGELKGISPDFLESAFHYPWPGNVRELIHAVLHALSVSGESPTLYAVHLPESVRTHVAASRIPSREPPSAPEPSKAPPEEAPAPAEDFFPDGPLPSFKAYREAVVRRAARTYLQELMTRCRGNIAQACTLSGLSRSRLYALMKETGFQEDHP